MQNQEIDIKNELERMLRAAMDGELASDAFMQALLTQQVFMPVRDEPDSGIKGFQRTTRATPLVVQDEDQRNTLVLFASPERARDFLAGMVGYSGGLLTDFAWILERMEPGVAITLNPGIEPGMDLEPDDVAQMLSLLAARAEKN